MLMIEEQMKTLQYTLGFVGKQVNLPNGEPLSAEEAEILKYALSRYLESLESRRDQDRIINSPSSTAYDRFIEWSTPAMVADENEDEAQYARDAWLQYDNRKVDRTERIARAEKWDLQFAAPEIQQRAEESDAFLKQLAELTRPRNI